MEEIRDRRGLTEEQAIERYRSRNYPKPALTADIVLFRRAEEGWQVLLVKRGGHPFLGKWALPGGFANENEPIERTAARELQEETGLENQKLRLVDLFSAPGRDPRGWVVSAAYCAVLSGDQTPRAGDDAARTGWFAIRQEKTGLTLAGGDLTLQETDLAFDHSQILRRAMALL